jgi:phage-related protein (TIGR01555 family)
MAKKTKKITGAQTTTDSYVNIAANLGITAPNLSAGGAYAYAPITRERSKLEMAYRGSWVCRMAIDVIPSDMTRAGIEILSDIPPDQIDKMQKEIQRLRVWESIRDAMRWARLYGGGIAVLLIEGQKFDTELRPETIGKGQFKGIIAFDRWMIQPSLQDLVTDYGPHLGEPRFYEIIVDSLALPRQKIHYSRVIRFDGETLPYWQRITENLWGLSVLEPLYDRLMAFDSTTTGAAQLVHKAHQRTLKIDGYRKLVAAGGQMYAAVKAQLDAIRLYQSSEGLTVLDLTDDFSTTDYNFGGLSDILLQFGQQLSGALGIPMVRLFGQSPAGLNSTGESDLRNYYDAINQHQEVDLRVPVGTVIDIVHRSLFGRGPEPGFTFGFKSLWQLSDEQKSTIAGMVTTAVTTAFEKGVISQAVAVKELRANSRISGVYTNITDEDIELADALLPPSPNDLAAAQQEQMGQEMAHEEQMQAGQQEHEFGMAEKTREQAPGVVSK